MKYFFSSLFEPKVKITKNEIPLIEINHDCLNNSASHVCYANGSNCCYNLDKNHYCNKNKIGCIY
jgi:hypothetical protein